VRDSNLDDTYLSVSARLAVESIKRMVEKKTAGGELTMRTEPPAPAGDPAKVTPIEPPELVQRLARARETYLARVDDAHDTEKVRDSYFYNNSLLLYLYGYWDAARQRFLAEFYEHCSGPKAAESGQVAWLNLRNMAVSLNESEEVRRLGAELQNRKCTFSPSGVAVAAVDCSKPENKDAPLCVAGQDLTNLRYRDAVAIFARAEKASGDEQRVLYEQAASELVKAVNEEPNHPQAPLALERAAIALERTSRFESAGRLYQRIIDEVGPRKATTPDDQAALDAILANAYFRLAYNANRFFDYDRAVANYRTLADSDRFAKSNAKEIAEWREGALINAATILEYQQQYARAGEYYARAAETLRDADEQRKARYQVAEMQFKLGQWNKAVTEMRGFITRYQNDKAAGELLVQAYARIAAARKAAGAQRDYVAARKDIITAFARSGQAPGSYAAEYAASAQFEEVDGTGASFEGFAIKPGKPATLDTYVKSVAGQIESGSREAKSKAEAYNVVPTYRRPTWTIAAFVRQGRIYEVLAKAVLNTPFVVPADLQRKMRGLPADSQDEVKTQVEDTIRQLLDSKVRPVECLAVGRYALAARAARAGNIDNDFTREAFDRINAYGDERIAECIAQVAAQDSTFQAYQPGEFKRAPRGLDLDIRARVSPPPMAGAR
jgi:tetratricopeptide (TPR) repeat protein